MPPPERNEHWKQEVGRRLALWRDVVRGQNQVDFAVEIGLPQPRLSNWETGLRLVDLAIACDLADRFGLTLDYLYRGQTGTLPHDQAQRLLKGNRPPKR